MNKPIRSLLTIFALVLALSLIAACSTTSTSETSVANIAGKTNSTQRAQIHTERAAEYYKIGNMAVAMEAIEQAITADAKYAPAYGMLAIIQMELKQDDKAQAAYEKALGITPDDSDLLNNYGWFICQRQSVVRSYSYFERSLKNPLYSTPERALYNWGVCAKRAGNLELAEKQLRAASERAPQFTTPIYELAAVAFAQSRLREAETNMSRYLQMVRDPNAEVLWLAIRIARAQGDRNSESAHLLQLRRRFPDAAETKLAFEGRQ